MSFYSLLLDTVYSIYNDKTGKNVSKGKHVCMKKSMNV